jgi:hypothetical protein
MTTVTRNGALERWSDTEPRRKSELSANAVMEPPSTGFAKKEKEKHRSISTFSLLNGIKMALILHPANPKMGFVGHKTVVICTSPPKRESVRRSLLPRAEIKTEHGNQQNARALKPADLHDWKPQTMVESIFENIRKTACETPSIALAKFSNQQP